jgi:DNA repair protein RadA/Sms
LTGELRHAAHPERRLAEAAKFGLEPVLRPGPRLVDLRSALRVAFEAQARSERAA